MYVDDENEMPEDVAEAISKISDFFALTALSLPDNKGPDTELVASGLLDSLSIVQLAMFVGDEMRVEFDDEDFTEENFATLGALARLISAKRKAQQKNPMARL